MIINIRIHYNTMRQVDTYIGIYFLQAGADNGHLFPTGRYPVPTLVIYFLQVPAVRW